MARSGKAWIGMARHGRVRQGNKEKGYPKRMALFYLYVSSTKTKKVYQSCHENSKS